MKANKVSQAFEIAGQIKADRMKTRGAALLFSSSTYLHPDLSPSQKLFILEKDLVPNIWHNFYLAKAYYHTSNFQKAYNVLRETIYKNPINFANEANRSPEKIAGFLFGLCQKIKKQDCLMDKLKIMQLTKKSWDEK